MSRLRDKYRDEVIPGLMKRYGYKNRMQVPRLSKVVINIGVGEAVQNARALEAAEADLTAISGQHPVTTRAKKSIAAFRLRTGMPIGLKVTLRGERMYEFLDKLMNAVLPRIREFQGVPRDSFDGRGNYTAGIKEQIIFPEMDYDKIDKVRGLEVSVITTANEDEGGRRLLEALGMPFTRDGES
jgi:large subunit ribosomal protein L5